MRALIVAVVFVLLATGIALAAPDCSINRCVYVPLARVVTTPTTAPTPTTKPTPIPPTPLPTAVPNCAAEYPTVCIPPPPPDLNCGDIPYRNFPVLPPDRHHFDTDHDGIGCEQ